jgi:hypothetical protein
MDSHPLVEYVVQEQVHQQRTDNRDGPICLNNKS